MQQSKTKVSEELLGIDQALNRAAANAKLQAQRQGTPYVVRTTQVTQKNTSTSKTG
jgi:hypothetical protein